MHKKINMLREFSIPLISGITAAIIWSNFFPESYIHFNHDQLIGSLSFHFLTNDMPLHRIPVGVGSCHELPF